MSFVIPRLLVTEARDMVTFCMEKLSLGAGSKCSTSLSSRGTAETLRMVRKSPILKYLGSLLFVLKGDRKERYLDMRQRARAGLMKWRQGMIARVSDEGFSSPFQLRTGKASP